MSEELTVLATRPNDLSLNFEFSTVERENWLLLLIPDLHIPNLVCTLHTHKHTHTLCIFNLEKNSSRSFM